MWYPDLGRRCPGARLCPPQADDEWAQSVGASARPGFSGVVFSESAGSVFYFDLLKLVLGGSAFGADPVCGMILKALRFCIVGGIPLLFAEEVGAGGTFPSGHG